jgi:hypothetical protein
LSGKSKEQIASSCSKKEQHYHQIDKKTIPPSNKVLVIGLGQLGLPVAKYIKDIGLVGGGDTSVGRAPEAVAVRMRDEERRQELLQVAGQFAPMSSSIQQLTSDQLKIDSEINP